MGCNHDIRLGPRLGPSDADLDRMTEDLIRSIKPKPSVHVEYRTANPETLGIIINGDLFEVDIVQFTEWVETHGRFITP